MKASRFSDAQKAFILKQGADGMPVADLFQPEEVVAAVSLVDIGALDVAAGARPHRSPSDAAPNHCSSRRRNPKNEIARFRDLSSQNLAIANPPSLSNSDSQSAA